MSLLGYSHRPSKFKIIRIQADKRHNIVSNNYEKKLKHKMITIKTNLDEPSTHNTQCAQELSE